MGKGSDLSISEHSGQFFTLRILVPGLDPDRWRILSPYLEEAFDLTNRQREDWLASLHQNDPELAQELRSLFETHGALVSEDFLEQHLVEFPEPSGLAGQCIGAYRLISEIGRGGMGTVWLAERNDGRFERKVAIKFLNISLLGKEGEERFKREGFILGRLAHPNIAELIDAGVSQSGQPYLVLEHVNGEHIDRYCDRFGLNIPSRIRLFLEVLGAVEHAHSKQVVHRDLKPSNVLVRNDGEPKLLDFGIAKLLEIEEPGYETQITIDGGRALTPDFAAPEQLTGQPVSPSTDIYTLGILLYLLLTGHHPISAGRQAPADVVKAVLDTEPLRPSASVMADTKSGEAAKINASRRATSPEKLSRVLRGDLDIIIMRSIKKVPSERYTTVNDLAHDLRCYLNSEPITARPDAIGYTAAKFIRRHKGRIAAALAVALTLIMAVGGTRLFSPKPKSMHRIKQHRVTANTKDLPVLNEVLSPDAAYLGYTDLHGLHLQQVETSTPVRLKLPPELLNDRSPKVFGGWYPNSRQFLASNAQTGRPVSLWSISTDGAEAQKIASVDGLWGTPRVSPDGSRIAYMRIHTQSGAGEIWLMGPKGEDPRLIKIADSQSSFSNLAWAPTGQRLAYIYDDHRAGIRNIALKSCDLEGRNVTTLVRDIRLDGFAWTSPERLVYSKTTDPGGTDSDNLLEVRVDENGVPQGQPQPLTDWSGFFATDFSSSRDGKHLAFLRGSSKIEIDVVDLTSNGTRVANLHVFNADENFNVPLAWTHDSTEIIFSSKRADRRLIYARGIYQQTPAQLITNTSTMSFYLARTTPDGAAILVEGSPNDLEEVSGIYRAELNGGAPRLLFATNDFVMYWCTLAEANFCVLGQMAPETNELAIEKFDPSTGGKKEALRIPLEPGSSARLGYDYSWQLSPNGQMIAILKRHDRWIKLVPLDGSATKTFSLKAHSDVFEVNWAADSKGLFLSVLEPDGASVLYADLKGRTSPLFKGRQALWIGAMQSPDGKRLAITILAEEANAWVVDDF